MAASRNRTRSRSPSLTAAIIRPAIFSCTTRWPVERSSLQAASKALPIATSVSGPNAEGPMNERGDMIAPFPFSGGSAKRLSVNRRPMAVAGDASNVLRNLQIASQFGQWWRFAAKDGHYSSRFAAPAKTGAPRRERRISERGTTTRPDRRGIQSTAAHAIRSSLPR
jgi:hypothetical protein